MDRVNEKLKTVRTVQSPVDTSSLELCFEAFVTGPYLDDTPEFTFSIIKTTKRSLLTKQPKTHKIM